VSYEAYPDLQGFRYPSSMNGNELAVALNARAEQADCLPADPELNWTLSDDALARRSEVQRSPARLRFALSRAAWTAAPPAKGAESLAL